MLSIDELIIQEDKYSEEASNSGDNSSYEYHKLMATLLRELKDSKEKSEDDLK